MYTTFSGPLQYSFAQYWYLKLISTGVSLGGFDFDPDYFLYTVPGFQNLSSWIVKFVNIEGIVLFWIDYKESGVLLKKSLVLEENWAVWLIWTWIPWNLSFRYINFTGQFTPKMKANAVPHLLWSLVWIDQYNECNGMTS